MSKLLFDESPLVVQPTLAKAIGLHEAIVLQQINYWLNLPRGGEVINGKKWIYNSLSDWQEQFPFISESSIYRALENLEWAKLIETGNYNKRKGDKTKWYTINEETVDLLQVLIEHEKELKEMEKNGTVPSWNRGFQDETPYCQDGTATCQDGTTLPETTTETPSDIENQEVDTCGIDFPKVEQAKRRTAEESRKSLEQTLASPDLGKKRSVADAKLSKTEIITRFSALLVSVKEQTSLPDELFKDDKDNDSYLARKAAERFLTGITRDNFTVQEVLAERDYFLNGGGEKYRDPRYNYSLDSIASDIRKHLRSLRNPKQPSPPKDPLGDYIRQKRMAEYGF